MMKSKKALGYGLAGLGAVLCLAYILLYAFGFRIYRFPVAHMTPTIEVGQPYVGRLTKGYSDEVGRNDVIVFSFEEQRDDLAEEQMVARLKSLHAHRVVGLPGDRVQFNHEGLFVNGEEVVTPNGPVVATKALARKRLELGESSFFVIGDNSAESLDSRFFGVVYRSEIKGRILFVE